jgi:hypothetical protein
MLLNLFLTSLVAFYYQRLERKKPASVRVKRPAETAFDLLKYYLPRKWKIWLAISTIGGLLLVVFLMLSNNP